MKKDVFEKSLNNKKGLIVSLIIIGVAVVLAAINYNYYHKIVKGVSAFIDVKKEDKYHYIDVNIMTDYFATYEDDDGVEKVYFVKDDKYFYIVKLSDKYREKLNDIYEYSYNDEVPKPKTVRIYGYSKYIKNDLKDIAIRYYNKLFQEDFLNKSNFENYLGAYLLDTTESPKGNFVTYNIAICVLGFIGLIQLSLYFKLKKNMNQVLNKYSKEIGIIKNEMHMPDCQYFEKYKLYITKSYFVALIGGFDIVKLSDVKWLYPHEDRVNGSTTTKSIIVYTNDGKMHTIAYGSINKRTIMTFSEMYDLACLSTPDAMHGYTKENIEKNSKKKK